MGRWEAQHQLPCLSLTDPGYLWHFRFSPCGGTARTSCLVQHCWRKKKRKEKKRKERKHQRHFPPRPKSIREQLWELQEKEGSTRILGRLVFATNLDGIIPKAILPCCSIGAAQPLFVMITARCLPLRIEADGVPTVHRERSHFFSRLRNPRAARPQGKAGTAR